MTTVLVSFAWVALPLQDAKFVTTGRSPDGNLSLPRLREGNCLESGRRPWLVKCHQRAPVRRLRLLRSLVLAVSSQRRRDPELSRRRLQWLQLLPSGSLQTRMLRLLVAVRSMVTVRCRVTVWCGRLVRCGQLVQGGRLVRSMVTVR